ncbi:hypothetical protein LJC53_05755 [Bacteroidales bacterium OttesenSCG-928-C03]|nr:hypothetical protein [Bacteroidales bacterium OttesenSCG-928-E04]MDL2309070.1 hypothetical protein [Bacteroidales bacterium OttesenSCG-928-C03]MDL2326820.1 hypothetical protein [Bacteroidales bacterium OttesenSCG-928-A14]
MYKFLNKNIVFHSFLLFALLVYAIYLILTQSNYIFSPESSIFDLLLGEMWQKNVLSMRIVAVFSLLLQIVLLQYYFRNNQFLEDKSLLPSIIYLALLVASGSLSSLSLVFFVNLFVILLLMLNSGYQTQSVKNQVFISGFIIGVLLFADVSSLLLFFFVFGSLLVNRFSKARDILLTLMGFLIPVIYAFAIYLFKDQYLVDSMDGYAFKFFGFYSGLSSLKVIEIIAFFFMVVVLLYFASSLTMIFSSKLIIMRRRLISINALTVVLLPILFVTPFAYPYSLAYMFIPITIYGALICQYKNKWVLNDFLLLALIVLLCL